MDFSGHPEFRRAVLASTSGDWDVARSAFERLIDEAEGNDDDVAISHLMHCVADVEARAGNAELAHELHQRAIGQNPGVPLRLIHYARSLVRVFDEPALAEVRLKQAEELIASTTWNRRIDSIGEDAYAELIAELRGEMTTVQDDA